MALKLEDQLTSFELSKKLKELGVKQNSLFCWTSDIDLEYLPTDIRNNNSCIAAFSVAEHGEMLPKEINGYIYTQIPNSDEDKWIVFYLLDERPLFINGKLVSFSDYKEADARAKMRIYLLENGLITNDKQN